VLEIVVRPDGPIQIIGPAVLRRPDGSTIESEPDPKGIFLRRCGLSRNKPFCDGMHKRSGWREEPQRRHDPVRGGEEPFQETT
jgi:CDGSH-type Zn-finger protein